MINMFQKWKRLALKSIDKHKMLLKMRRKQKLMHPAMRELKNFKKIRTNKWKK